MSEVETHDIDVFRKALETIVGRFEREDDGGFLLPERAGRIAWAMCSDAKEALNNPSGRIND